MLPSTQSIREIVKTHPSAINVFERFDIDLCSRADSSLEQACAELQLSVDQVLEKLSQAQSAELGAIAPDPADLSLTQLIQHIVRVHHQKIRQELPRLAEMARKVAAKRSDRAPELGQVVVLLEEIHSDLLACIQKQEQVLFPFIAQMDQDLIVNFPAGHACFRSVSSPVFMMEREHKTSSDMMGKLRTITSGFEPPQWACITHSALFTGMRDFEADLRQHAHLENDVLFPRAIEMEAVLNKRG